MSNSGEGTDIFHAYFYKILELNIPYDQLVREMITASAVSTWTSGPANFVARHRVMDGDGYSVMNHEDTCDELAIWTSKLFLGVNVECVSCHDGAPATWKRLIFGWLVESGPTSGGKLHFFARPT